MLRRNRQSRAGVKDVEIHDPGPAPGKGIHEMGTARMGRDRKNSVLNQHNQVWDAHRTSTSPMAPA